MASPAIDRPHYRGRKQPLRLVIGQNPRRASVTPDPSITLPLQKPLGHHHQGEDPTR